MPTNQSKAPPVMTWLRALPILGIALVFDALRIFFAWFWLFAPALAAYYCASKVNGIVGATAGDLLCGGAGAVAGYLGFAPLVIFGQVMAMAIGLLGWLIVGFLMLITNARVFREEAGSILWLVISLAVSEVPFLDTIPAMTISTSKIYYGQIKKEKKAFKKWQKSAAAQKLREQQEQQFRVAQIMNAKQAQAIQADASAEQDNEEIPEEERVAA